MSTGAQATQIALHSQRTSRGFASGKAKSHDQNFDFPESNFRRHRLPPCVID